MKEEKKAETTDESNKDEKKNEDTKNEEEKKDTETVEEKIGYRKSRIDKRRQKERSFRKQED